MQIGLVQINTKFKNQCYFPYSIGLIQAFLSRYSKSELFFSRPIFFRKEVKNIVRELVHNDVVLFSLYVWNEQISLAIAKELKRINPNIKLVFGGPQVPDKAEPFLRQHSFIDFIIHGEGEEACLELVDSVFAHNVLSTSFLYNNVFISNPKRPRCNNLSKIPSPYLSNVFDELMTEFLDIQWIVSWETNRGCPFSCSFCDWGSSTQSKIYQFPIERLYKEIEWFAEKKIDFVFCCDANFGILNRDLQIVEYISKIKKETGYPKSLSVQNTKNSTERTYFIQKLLSDNGLNKGVTLSLQSLNKIALSNIRRSNISIDSYQELQKKFSKDKVETYTDIILGLPGETYTSYIKGIDTIISNGQYNRIQFNNLSILPNSEMGNQAYLDKYQMVVVETDIINIHGSLANVEHETLEKQKLVVATKTMPATDWIKARAISWWVGLLFFDKIFQIPSFVINQVFNHSYTKIFESFLNIDRQLFPTIAMVNDFFIEKAKKIQNGDKEYCLSKEFLNIYWTADELILITLMKEGKVEEFYRECLDLLSQNLKITVSNGQLAILEDAIFLNKSLLKFPFYTTDLEIRLKTNIVEFYYTIISGNNKVLLEKKANTHIIDRTSKQWNSWDIFCKEVIWYNNKKGSYLYNFK